MLSDAPAPLATLEATAGPRADGAPSQFYTGLVAELYESLVSEPASAAQYQPFLHRAGEPALELACGSGSPLLDLVAAGYQVEGLDASADMLTRCRSAAAARGLTVTVHHALMQAFSLPRCYRAIFLAGASFTLLTTDADARSALACAYRHLLPGGSVLVPLEIVTPEVARAAIGEMRETDGSAGERLRCGVVAVSVGADGRTLCRRLRYERIRAGAEPQVLERDWHTRWWSQQAFADMLQAAGFRRVRMRAVGGGPAAPDASRFVALAQRPTQQGDNAA